MVFGHPELVVTLRVQKLAMSSAQSAACASRSLGYMRSLAAVPLNPRLSSTICPAYEAEKLVIKSHLDSSKWEVGCPIPELSGRVINRPTRSAGECPQIRQLELPRWRIAQASDGQCGLQDVQTAGPFGQTAHLYSQNRSSMRFNRSSIRLNRSSIRSSWRSLRSSCRTSCSLSCTSPSSSRPKVRYTSVTSINGGCGGSGASVVISS